LPPLDVYENKQALLNRLLEERAREPLKPLNANAVKLTRSDAEHEAEAVIFDLALAVMACAIFVPMIDWAAVDEFLDANLGEDFGLNRDRDRHFGEYLDGLFFMRWPMSVLIPAVVLSVVLIYLFIGFIRTGITAIRHWSMRGNPIDRQKKIYVALIWEPR